VHDEELAGGGVGVGGAGHGEDTAGVFAVGAGVEFGLEAGVAVGAGAGAGGVAALDHEAGDDAMEDHAVVEPLAGEVEEVLDVVGGDVGPEFDGDVAFGGFDGGGGGFDIGGLGHVVTPCGLRVSGGCTRGAAGEQPQRGHDEEEGGEEEGRWAEGDDHGVLGLQGYIKARVNKRILGSQHH